MAMDFFEKFDILAEIVSKYILMGVTWNKFSVLVLI